MFYQQILIIIVLLSVVIGFSCIMMDIAWDDYDRQKNNKYYKTTQILIFIGELVCFYLMYFTHKNFNNPINNLFEGIMLVIGGLLHVACLVTIGFGYVILFMATCVQFGTLLWILFDLFKNKFIKNITYKLNCYEKKNELELRKKELEELIRKRSNNMGANRDNELAIEIQEKIQAKIQEIKVLEPEFFEF